MWSAFAVTVDHVRDFSLGKTGRKTEQIIEKELWKVRWHLQMTLFFFIHICSGSGCVCVFVNLCLWAKIQRVFVSAWLFLRNSPWLKWQGHSLIEFSVISPRMTLYSHLSLSLQWLLFCIKRSVPASPKLHALLSPQITFFTARVVRHIQSTEWEAQLGLTLKICVSVCVVTVPKRITC